MRLTSPGDLMLLGLFLKCIVGDKSIQHHICPNIDFKTEGDHDHPWVLTEASNPVALGPNKFIDNRVFNPDDLVGYLERFENHSLRVDLSDLSALNT